MLKSIFLLSIFLFLKKSEAALNVQCDFLKKAAHVVSLNQKKDFKVKFMLGYDTEQPPIEINGNNWRSALKDRFNQTKQTYIIIHGFKSSGDKPWVHELKNAIFQTNKFNVIIVDWSDGCSKLDYAGAASNTVRTSTKIFNFLYHLKNDLRKMGSRRSREVKWNQIFFAGHSLGAHIAGQTSSLLREEKLPFFHTKKVTGLDPAGPCFKDGSEDARLDEDDADLVEVIHTQHSEVYSLGSGESLGHIDFFVNGGAKQPRCEESDEFSKVCSHGRAYEYFAESFYSDCEFKGYAWSGGYKQALDILNDFFKDDDGFVCETCPTMGHKDDESNSHGNFLVITGTQKKFCNFRKDRDYEYLKNMFANSIYTPTPEPMKKWKSARKGRSLKKKLKRL